MKYFILLYSFLAILITYRSGIVAPHFHNDRYPANESCSNLIHQFLTPKQLKLEIRPGSLFYYDASLIKRVDELRAPEINLSGFYEDFDKTNHRAPTLREALNFIINKKMDVIKKYDLLIADLEKRNKNDHLNLAILIEELKKSKDKLSHFKGVDQLNSELKASYHNDKTAIMNLDETIQLKENGQFQLIEEHYTYLKNKLGLSNFQGEYGEIMALSSANEKIISRGLMFKDMNSNAKNYANEISQIVDHFEQELAKKTDDELINLVKKHGNGLLRHTQEYIEDTKTTDLSKETMIKKIMSMVRSKEIDVVLIDSKGKFVWSEVKAYNETISKETISHSTHNGKKTIYEQLIEHQALAEILGIKNLRFRFISPLSSIDPEAQKMISSLGYEVVFAQ